MKFPYAQFKIKKIRRIKPQQKDNDIHKTQSLFEENIVWSTTNVIERLLKIDFFTGNINRKVLEA